jgi:hypothetical protein
MQACKYVPGAELLQMDPSDACEKLRTLLKVLGGFKLHYFAYKTASAAECPNHPWRFQNSVVFGRLDTFMERCADMLDLQSTCMQVNMREQHMPCATLACFSSGGPVLCCQPGSCSGSHVCTRYQHRSKLCNTHVLLLL